MTAQMLDTLNRDGKKQALNCFPLDSHPERARIGMPGMICTACYRGYIADWEVEDDLLWLVRPGDSHRAMLHLLSRSGFQAADSGFEKVFPAENGNVRADWFSGMLYPVHPVEEPYPAFIFHAGRLLHEENISSEGVLLESRLTTFGKDFFGPEEGAFLEMIHENPEDSASRLIYADWLEERGDPRAAPIRAEMRKNGGTGFHRRRIEPFSSYSPKDTSVDGNDREWFWKRLVGFPLGD